MRRYYPLPAIERGCNTIDLYRLGTYPESPVWWAEFQPGNAEWNEDLTEMVEGSFVADPDLRMIGREIRDPADFAAWFEEFPRRPGDTLEQHFATGVLSYMWLQQKGVRPLPGPDSFPEPDLTPATGGAE